MESTTPASVLDAAPAPSASTDLTHALADSRMTALLRALTASWHPASTIADRRREHRLACDFSATLVPVDNHDLVPSGLPQEVDIRDLSRHGIGISHDGPMPHRLVLVGFEPAGEAPIRLVVRLKWCRFKGTNVYESGGRIVRVLKPGENLGAAPCPPPSEPLSSI